MAQATKSQLYQALKAVGYPLDKEWKHYTKEELADIYQRIAAEPPKPALNQTVKQQLATEPIHIRGREHEVIRVDEEGRQWYQEEIVKSSTAKPRGYRIFREIGSGTKTITIDTHDNTTETFEVADGQKRPLEVKVGIPTWQVGIYKDPRFPFKTICYRNAEGFDREDVENYFGGRDLLPETIVPNYVGNLLCYDIRSVVTTIQRTFTQLQQKGNIL